MLRSLVARALAASILLAGLSTAHAIDDPRLAADFLHALRERGYYDLALEYLEQLRQSPETPADLRKSLDFEEGRTLIEAATHANDPDASKEKLDQAKLKIEAFVKANPDLPQITEALVELAHLLYERGLTEVDLAGDARAAGDKDNKLASARGYYASARDAYGRAFDRLNVKLNAFPKFIAADDPKKAERERVRNSVMQAELQKSVVDYYEAQTYPADSKERPALLEKALASFDDIYKRYRVQMAGFTARMWQGKCYEEQGKLREAMGIYNELIDHPDPNLRRLQKQVDFFRIIVMAKRKEYAKAADECSRWLAMFPKDRRSYEALGVQLELAKNIIAQLPDVTGPDKDRAVRLASDNLAEVVRVVSPFKPEAIALLQKYRPNAALSASDAAKLNYDDAVAQAEQSIAVLEYEKAIALLKVAIRKADPIRDPSKANKARFTLAFCLYMTKRPYEAAVIAEHIARRYPSFEWAAKAGDVALQSMVDAYSNILAGNRTSDLDRIVSLADHIAETWPETEQGDSGRMTIGLVALGRGKYPDALKAFDSVRSASSKFIDAQAAGGDAHWKQSLMLRDQGKAPEADAEVKAAVGKISGAIKARREANVPDTDPGLISNACDLAGIYLETNRATEALSLLEPIAKKLATATRNPSANSAYSRVLAGILRAHVATGKTDLAIADMKTLESVGGATSANGVAQLYFDLGKLLEREIENLKKRSDKNGLARTQDAYQKFLGALVASKSGQTFQSLQWAGEQFLKLNASKDAGEVFTRVLDTYSKDEAFLKRPNATELLLRVRLKQIAALRGERNFSEAESKLNEIIGGNKRLLEPQMEMGFLLDAKSEAKEATWTAAYTYWRALATKLAGMNPKPAEYYEAWYHAAVALQKQGKPDLAKQTVASVMRLNPSVGNPEMKLKYQDLIAKLGK